MKLFYLPGACSLVPHIALREAGLDFEPVRVNRDKTTEHGDDFLAINPLGYVPALQLDTGEVLTEVSAVAQYIADLRPEAGLAPPAGTLDRVRLQQWLARISTELHKPVGALFDPTLDEAARAKAVDRAELRLGQIDALVGARDWLVGDRFSVADAYLYTVTAWLPLFKLDLARWSNLARIAAKVAERPAVVAARRAEKGPGKH